MPLPRMTPQRNGSSLREVEAAVLDGRDGGDQGELGEAVQAAGGLGVEDGLGVEVLDLAAEVDLEGGGVELLDRADAALAGAAGPARSLSRREPSGLTVPMPVMTTRRRHFLRHAPVSM